MGTLRRDTVTKMFSTFLKLEAGRFDGWLTDPKLRRNMQNYLEGCTENQDAENFWVLYWYGAWRRQTVQLAERHLLAYLQEPSYWAVEHVTRRHTSGQFQPGDYFLIAIAQFKKVLEDFEPKKGFKLKSFAQKFFLNILRDELRRRKEADLCTRWGFLRKVGQRRFVEALQNGGLSLAEVNQYVLARRCFRELYVATQPGGTAQLPEPDFTLWKKVANLYNEERLNLATPSSSCTPQLIEQWLVRAERLVRNYLYPPPPTSLTPPEDDDTRGEIDLPDSSSLLDTPENKEAERQYQEQLAEMHGVLTETLSSLDSEWKLVLRLYYCENLTLQQIAANLGENYNWVQRRVFKAKKRLLEALLEWGRTITESQGKVNISLDSNQVKLKGAVLEEWLEIRSREFESHLL